MSMIVMNFRSLVASCHIGLKQYAEAIKWLNESQSAQVTAHQLFPGATTARLPIMRPLQRIVTLILLSLGIGQYCHRIFICLIVFSVSEIWKIVCLRSIRVVWWTQSLLVLFKQSLIIIAWCRILSEKFRYQREPALIWAVCRFTSKYCYLLTKVTFTSEVTRASWNLCLLTQEILGWGWCRWMAAASLQFASSVCHYTSGVPGNSKFVWNRSTVCYLTTVLGGFSDRHPASSNDSWTHYAPEGNTLEESTHVCAR